MEVVEARTLGEGWLEVSRRILDAGLDAAYDGQATKELALVTLRVARPDPADALIASLADPAWLDWMRRNFTLDFGKKACEPELELMQGLAAVAV